MSGWRGRRGKRWRVHRESLNQHDVLAASAELDQTHLHTLDGVKCLFWRGYLFPLHIMSARSVSNPTTAPENAKQALKIHCSAMRA